MNRTARRPDRPYLASRESDAAALVSTQLMTELWILKDRVAVLEQLLQERQVLSRVEISEYVPTGSFAEELDRERDAYVSRVAGAPFNDETDIEALRRASDVG